MGRTNIQKSNKQTSSGYGGVRGSRVQKTRRKHKVVLESAGNKDEDKLQVVLSFHSDPPPGYTFIPAGNTQLTAALKIFAKRGGYQVMAVSATPHAQRHELSREVHRIGYHFPTEVVSQVCAHYGIRLDSSGRLIGEQESEKLFMKISQKGEVVLNENIRDQVTINTEAKEIIRDLFPKIPDNDLFQIIKTAFQLGDNKVGTAEEIPLVRRAQLSVVAHIRHSYTNYDKLLRQVPYNEARHMVETSTLMKLMEWRGDENDLTEDSRKAVDDAVREVVVLSEDDSESELEEGQVLENEDVKVEPVRKTTQPIVTTQHRTLSPAELSSGEEAPKGYRFVPRVSQRNLYDLPEAEARARQQSRYAVWDQVRQEYKMAGSFPRDTQVVTRIPLDEVPVVRSAPVAREVVYDRSPAVHYVLEDPPPAQVMQELTSPVLFRGADGRLYERLPTRYEEHVATARRIYTPPTGSRTVATHQTRRSASPRPQSTPYHRRTPSLINNGTIAQSIERTEPVLDSPRIRQRPSEAYRELAQEPERRAPERRRNLIDLTSSAEQADRRMRTSASPPPSPYFQKYDNTANEVYIRDEKPSHRQRQLIELSHQPPVSSHRYPDNRVAPPPFYQPLNLDGIHARGSIQQEYAAPRHENREIQYYQREATHLPERRVVYEPVNTLPPPRPVRYVIQEPIDTPVRQVGQGYYIANEYVEQRRPPTVAGSYPSNGSVVHDDVEVMDDVQPSTNTRYPLTYRTTYVQN